MGEGHPRLKSAKYTQPGRSIAQIFKNLQSLVEWTGVESF